MKPLGECINGIHKKIEKEANCLIDKNIGIDGQVLIFHERLIKIIRPRNQSDRTSFANISSCILRKIKSGDFEPKVLEQILRYATEASGPKSRNPAAVFMAILKKELKYGKED